MQHAYQTMQEWVLSVAKGSPQQKASMVIGRTAVVSLAYRVLVGIFAHVRLLEDFVLGLRRATDEWRRGLSAASACVALLLGILHCVGNSPPSLECIKNDNHFHLRLPGQHPRHRGWRCFTASPLVVFGSVSVMTPPAQANSEGQFEFTIRVELPDEYGRRQLIVAFKHPNLCVKLVKV